MKYIHVNHYVYPITTPMSYEFNIVDGNVVFRIKDQNVHQAVVDLEGHTEQGDELLENIYWRFSRALYDHEYNVVDINLLIIDAVNEGS